MRDRSVQSIKTRMFGPRHASEQGRVLEGIAPSARSAQQPHWGSLVRVMALWPKVLVAVSACAMFAGGAWAGSSDATSPVSKLKSLQFREIGPSNMGGRVDDIAVVESSPTIMFAGLASGGVWKTTNSGTTWTPVFDNEGNSSIGAIAVARSNPSIVWVGTGEPNNRQSSS